MVLFVQTMLVAALSLAAFALEAFALIDAARTRADAFVATGKLTKTKWLIILAVATVVGFIALPYPLGGGASTLWFLGLIAVAAASVYLVDVRPAVRQIRGGGGGKRGGQMGPYGPW